MSVRSPQTVRTGVSGLFRGIHAAFAKQWHTPSVIKSLTETTDIGLHWPHHNDHHMHHTLVNEKNRERYELRIRTVRTTGGSRLSRKKRRKRKQTELLSSRVDKESCLATLVFKTVQIFLTPKRMGAGDCPHESQAK